MTEIFNQSLINEILKLAEQAGNAILALYHSQKTISFALKPNKTPVTEADLIANEIIRNGS